jgi:hypothetical protein
MVMVSLCDRAPNKGALGPQGVEEGKPGRAADHESSSYHDNTNTTSVIFLDDLRRASLALIVLHCAENL